MWHLNGVYTQAFNRWHARSGHLFQGRFKAILVQKESQAPRSGPLCRAQSRAGASGAKSRRLGWSSYRATAGLSSTHGILTVDWILTQFPYQPVVGLRNALEVSGEDVIGHLEHGPQACQKTPFHSPSQA